MTLLRCELRILVKVPTNKNLKNSLAVGEMSQESSLPRTEKLVAPKGSRLLVMQIELRHKELARKWMDLVIFILSSEWSLQRSRLDDNIHVMGLGNCALFTHV